MIEKSDAVELLKYRRKNSVWVCNECETENHLDYVRCLVCGKNKTGMSKILVPWYVEEEEKKKREALERASRAALRDTEADEDELEDEEEEESEAAGGYGMGILLVVLIALVLGLLIVAGIAVLILAL